MAQIIEDKLRRALAPIHLDVVNDSAHHAGHVGARDGGGESHFTVEVVSERFSGMRPVARQRLVYEILKEELSGKLHALSLVTRAPDDAP
ncbi:MAG TPA: BolA family protein [Stellaceae bacterium]|nr:BolA family protein [Stellaceae bacterium]